MYNKKRISLLLIIIMITEILGSVVVFAANPNFPEEEIARNVSSTEVLYNQMKDPYVDKKIPVAATVKVGTKLDAISFSKPGMPGAKVNKYDWQLAYWDLEEKAYDKAYIVDITERANFTQVADKPGQTHS